MRLLIQRVTEAQVWIEEKIFSEIKKGLLVFIGIHKEDEKQDVLWLAQKLIHLRIFPDQEDRMHFSVKQIEGEILVVSQFTLYGQCNKGRRPDFFEAALPSTATVLYEDFIQELKKEGVEVKTGSFGASMGIKSFNDGPVTFFLDSRNR